jgi:P-type Ca2+ transporter type 2C
MAKISWHAESISETLNHFSVDAKNGLSGQQVDLVHERGVFNELPSKESDPWWKVFIRQFLSPLILVLIVAAVISALLHEWVDVGVITAAIMLNTLIGFVQEYKASRALEQLRSLIQPHAVVLRNGREEHIEARDIVEGDILLLHAGDQVTADARIIDAVEFMVSEAALTGESVPVKKQTEVMKEGVLLADRKNMVYAGTSVVGGRGRAVVVGIGFESEIGKIASLVEKTDESSTPLQEQLVRLARWIAIAVTVIVIVLFLYGIWQGQAIAEMFELSVALAVAAIPEGLVISVTIILAIGMQRILKRRSLVRRLVGAETLGSVSVICTDKTGTITEGEMRATHIATTDETILFDEVRHGEDKGVDQILLIASLCNDAIQVKNSDQQELKGSSTERALLEATVEQGLDQQALLKEHPRDAEIPFDSVHKYMVTQHVWGSSHAWLLKGAPSRVLSFCSHYFSNGKKHKMTDEARDRIMTQEQALAEQGLRLMAFGFRSGVRTKLEKEHLKDFTFFGFIGLRDPLRKEVKQQIQDAKDAGVRTVMVTGDHPQTAWAIGVEAGLVAGPESVVVGSDLDEWSDEELERRVNRITIYARVEPRHKIRIVSAWQARGEVVAMTGDGVNDAPALKSADVGIAVGSGTEVAKQASDVVILDNDLGTITAAIEQGRVMFDNIRKTTVYLVAGSFTEIILIAGSIMMGLPLPLLSAQILWINLVADSLPSIGLAFEPGERDVMNIPPRGRKEPVLNKDMFWVIFIIGFVTNAVLFAVFIWLLGQTDDIGTVRSFMFAAVGIDSLFYVFAVKSFRQTIFQINPFSNLYLIGGVLIGFGMMIVALVHPFFQAIFEITPLHLSHWGLLLMIGLVKLVIIEIIKDLFLLRKKKTNTI